MSKPASCRRSPPSSGCSASQRLDASPTSGGKNRSGSREDRRAPRAGSRPGRRVARAIGATAPMWSMCVWVSRIASGSTPSSPIAACRRSASSPGSMSSACVGAVARAPGSSSPGTAPTVNIRTSTATCLALLELFGLPAAVEEEVGVVAQRHVEEQHEAAQRDRRRDRLVDDEDHRGDEDDRGDRRALHGAAHGRRLAEAVHARLAGGSSCDRPARACGRCDRASRPSRRRCRGAWCCDACASWGPIEISSGTRLRRWASTASPSVRLRHP